MKLVLGMLFAVSGAVAGAFVWLSSTGDDSGTRVRLDFGDTPRAAGRAPDSRNPDSRSPDSRNPGSRNPGSRNPGNGTPDRRRADSDPGTAPLNIEPPARRPGDPRRPRRSVQVVPALLEKGPHGALPKISRDGRAAWRVYGRPYNRADRRPRIAIIITGLGLKADVTESAIEDLPGVVSLSFSPYGRKLQDYAAAARKTGHEILLSLPLETRTESGIDPGPRALQTGLDRRANRDRLHWIMGRASGYVGLLAYPVGRFASNNAALNLMLDEARKRGVLIVDGRPGGREESTGLFGQSGVVWSRATVWLDQEPSPAKLDEAFAAAEAAARRHGAAIVIGQPYPLTLTRIRSWIETFRRKKIAAVPVSAVVRAGD